MKNVLCFGDSNTWGFNAASKDRYSKEIRWTGIVGTKLGEEYNIIEEGLSGRTTVWEDPFMQYQSGREYLNPCLRSHKPIDLVIIMLGTCDLKNRFSLSAYDIANGAGVLADIVKKSGTGYNGNSPKVLLISPILVGNITESEYGEDFALEKSVSTSKKLAYYYKRVADQMGCEFLDASLFASASTVDALHLDENGHKKLGDAIADKIRNILG